MNTLTKVAIGLGIAAVVVGPAIVREMNRRKMREAGMSEKDIAIMEFVSAHPAGSQPMAIICNDTAPFDCRGVPMMAEAERAQLQARLSAAFAALAPADQDVAYAAMTGLSTLRDNVAPPLLMAAAQAAVDAWKNNRNYANSGLSVLDLSKNIDWSASIYGAAHPISN